MVPKLPFRREYLARGLEFNDPARGRAIQIRGDDPDPGPMRWNAASPAGFDASDLGFSVSGRRGAAQASRATRCRQSASQGVTTNSMTRAAVIAGDGAPIAAKASRRPPPPTIESACRTVRCEGSPTPKPGRSPEAIRTGNENDCPDRPEGLLRRAQWTVQAAHPRRRRESDRGYRSPPRSASRAVRVRSSRSPITDATSYRDSR